MNIIRKTTLADVPVGTTFMAWSREYTLLDKSDSSAFVIARWTERNMPFHSEPEDEESQVPLNDFRNSPIRYWLNDDYLGELQECGLRNEQIYDMRVDLKCTLGQHEYGEDKVKVGLLTMEQFGKYYDIIPKLEENWWLATPWKTPCRSTSVNYPKYVWRAFGDGNCGTCMCDNTLGVRPVMSLSLELEVEWEDEMKFEEYGWSEYIKYLHKWAVEHSNVNYAGCYPAVYDEPQEWVNEL